MMEGNRRPLAYYAAGSREQVKRAFTLEVEAVLDESGYETWLSHESAGLPSGVLNQGMGLAEVRHHVFEQNLQALEGSKVLVFALTGNSLDAGACVEVGIAYGRGMRCIGLRTDRHEAEDGEPNLMVEGVLDYEIANDLDGLRSLLSASRTVVDLTATDGSVTVDLRAADDPYVVVSGPLGVGKTSLIEIMGRTGIWTVLPEPNDENPYLSEAYSNLTDLSFRMQTFYMSNRARQHHSARKTSGPIVQERCLGEDGEVFNRALHDYGAYDDNDLATLMTLHGSLREETLRPNLIVYLTAPFEVTVARIQKRDRVAERDLDRDLLRIIYDRYERWSFEQTSLLRIDTSEFDYVDRPETAAEIMRRIDVALTEVAVIV